MEMDSDALILYKLTIRRVGRVLMYLGLTIAGTLATVFPSQLVVQQVGTIVVVFWSLAMTISAAIAMWGAFTDRWIGEFSGIPLLGTALALYGISAIAATNGQSPALLAYGLVVLSFSAGLAARWKDVQIIKTHATTANDDTRET